MFIFLQFNLMKGNVHLFLIHYTSSEIFQAFFVLVLMMVAYRSWKSKTPVSQNMKMFQRTNKKGIYSTEMLTFRKECLFISFGASLRCFGGPGSFDGDFRLVCIDGSFVSQLPLDNTYLDFSLDKVSLFKLKSLLIFQ